MHTSYHVVDLVADYLKLPPPDNSPLNRGDAPLFDMRLGKALIKDRETLGRLLQFGIVHASDSPQSDMEWVAMNAGAIFTVLQMCDGLELSTATYKDLLPGT